MQARLFAVVVLCVVLGLTAAGVSGAAAPNGEASKTPAQILTDVKAAVAAAKAVHVFGSGTDDKGLPILLDLHLIAGKGGGGHITASGLSFEMIRIETKAYFQGGTAFWTKLEGKTAAQLFAGRWIVASAVKGDLASFTPLTDIPKLINSILASHGTLKVTGTTSVNGQQVVAITDTSEGGTLYIAATGAPYPIELLSKGKGKLTFAGWNKVTPVNAPKNALDFTKELKKS